MKDVGGNPQDCIVCGDELAVHLLTRMKESSKKPTHFCACGASYREIVDEPEMRYEFVEMDYNPFSRNMPREGAKKLKFVVEAGTTFVYPGGRFKSDGPSSGEALRDDYLVPAYKAGNAAVVVKLDGALGWPSSFLEEAFGGFVDKVGPGPKLILVSKDRELVREIEGYMRDREQNYRKKET
jgi:hypothetical protein